jgi:nucleotide-binding universal stress UspA family protein
MPSPRQPHGYRQIVIAYDGSQGARAAAERVAAIVTSETVVTVITVIPSEPIEAKPDSVDTDQSEWQWNSLAEATALLRSHGIRPFIEAVAGDVAHTIRETAHALNADLVVLGRDQSEWQHPSVERPTVWGQVLQQLECDTLVVRAK